MFHLCQSFTQSQTVDHWSRLLSPDSSYKYVSTRLSNLLTTRLSYSPLSALHCLYRPTHKLYHMPEIFNIILVSMSRLLFSTPSFVKLAERSLLGARQVQDSSGEFFSGPVTGESSTFRGVSILIFGVVAVLTSRLPGSSSI